MSITSRGTSTCKGPEVEGMNCVIEISERTIMTGLEEARGTVVR